MGTIAAILWLAIPGQIKLPGTQPGELTVDLRAPGLCVDCHGGYADYAAHDTWSGTMMANAARDPLFQAALTIANQDEPGSGDLCIRCHSPRAWLFGRSNPPVLDNFEEADYEGVQCDFCHRIVEGAEGERLIGNGQYFVADDLIRRGPIEDALAPHEWVYSEYHRSSELCALCHDVSNPLRDGFAIERTYTEWLSSAFSAEDRSCQSCHLPATEDGFACGARDMPEREVHGHELVGGNTWVPRVLAGEYPELGREEAYQRTIERAEEMLASAAEVTIEIEPEVVAGDDVELVVRVENLAGHKLPTGYPEGRRCWLEVEVKGAEGEPLFHSGAYDLATGERADDPQLRTYEVRMAAGGEEGFHFMLQDELLQDNRIPPRGFTPAPDTAPVGREYEVLEGGALAHWDDAPYEIAIPEDALAGAATVRASLLYQTTSREYVEFLRDENRTDDRGDRLFDLWERYDRSPPVSMATAEASLTIEEPPSSSSCGCSARTQGGGGSLLLVVASLLLAARRPRRRGQIR